jgi:phosphatidate cytidylyltransferase
VLSDLAVRLVSAVILGVPFVLSVHAGAPYFDVWIIVAAVLLAWEWFRMVSGGNGVLGPAGITFVACAAVPVLVASFLSPAYALAIVAAASLALLVIMPGGGWLAAGLPYLTLPCIALLWLRYGVPDGRLAVFWLIAVVWASDIGAYFAGRIIGGPKLAPAISPNKTWAGFFGGAIAALLAGLATAPLTGADADPLLAATSVLIGGCAQGGDLAESWLKRRFGAKDASALIPGHGGVLDRVDGLMAAAMLLALIDLSSKGSILRWL